MTINVLTDVGGVTFTFDKQNRKRIWVEESGNLVKSVLEKKQTNVGLQVNPYATEFGIKTDFQEEFTNYAKAIAETLGLETRNPEFAEQAGKEVLKGMLLDPTATALLEYIQDQAIADGRIKPTEIPGIRDLIDYAVSTGGVFQGYSTGAPKMPDQFHTALGLDVLVGNVRTTFPGHQAKKRSPAQIVEQAKSLYSERGQTFSLHIDDQDNEIEMWAQAREIMRRQNLGDPTIYLFKSSLPTNNTGTAGDNIVVINSIDQITGPKIERESTYKIDFKKDDKKFG